MTNLRYYIALVVGAILFFMYWFKENADVYYERPVQEVSAIEAGKKLAMEGKGNIMACTACHGSNGQGEGSYPRLAGLNAAYITKQLEDFSSDSPSIRHDEIMSPISKAMSKEDIKNLSAYYSTLAFTAVTKELDKLTLEVGEELALRGKPELMMPRCEACHGPKGEGFRELFPALAGQSEQYIINQINKWQRSDRNNDKLSLMKNIANKMTDEDKINIAKYYSNMPFSINEEN